MTKAAALLHGRNYAIPDDVRYIFNDVAGHRLILTAKAKASGEDINSVLSDIISKVPSPKI